MLKPEREWPEGTTKASIIADLSEKLMNVPGYVPGFLQPIENRVLMTSTGIRAQVGVKIYGDNLDALQQKAFEVEALDYRRAKDEGDRSLEAFKFFVNALYVALTRAVTNVYLVEDDPTHPLLGLLEVPFDGGPRAFEAALRFAAAVWNIEVARERGWTPASVEELRAKLAPGVPGDAPQGLRRAGRAEARPVRGRPPDGRHLEAQALGARLRRGDAGVAASRDDRPRDRGRPHALTSGGLASTCC